jgi:hypothetical protein
MFKAIEEEHGLSSCSSVGKSDKNATRNVIRSFNVFGLSLKVPIDMVKVGEWPHIIKLPMIRITSFVKVLLKYHSFLAFGGFNIGPEAKAQCSIFWSQYRWTHDTHVVFKDHAEHLDRVIPMALHMDGGPGLKNCSLDVASFEFPIGIDTAQNVRKIREPCLIMGSVRTQRSSA